MFQSYIETCSFTVTNVCFYCLTSLDHAFNVVLKKDSVLAAGKVFGKCEKTRATLLGTLFHHFKPPAVSIWKRRTGVPNKVAGHWAKATVSNTIFVHFNRQRYNR